MGGFTVGSASARLPATPTHQQGTGSLLAGGFALASAPPHQQGTESLLAGGFALASVRARLSSPPTHQQGTHPCQGCCPCARWAEPDDPAVKNKLPPPCCYKVTFLTAVTAMLVSTATLALLADSNEQSIRAEMQTNQCCGCFVKVNLVLVFQGPNVLFKLLFASLGL